MTDIAPFEIEVQTRAAADEVCATARKAGLMVHVEDHEVYFVVHIATPQWVTDYYRNGGVWGFGPFPE